MYKTMEIGFWWKTMRQDVQYTVKTCEVCQKYKKQRKKYGKLPPKDAGTEGSPWERVNVDLIGPLSVTTPSGQLEGKSGASSRGNSSSNSVY